MKKTILVVLMAVMVATPCLAQDIEPEGIFSIEGTAWGVLILFPLPLPPMGNMYAFYNHKVYFYRAGSPSVPNPGWNMYQSSFFVDMFVASFFAH